ncbi:tRNA (adenosine(37)-N6)-dimethylallyltransferase MiaA [Candidatus Daviesbacteria bacterium]|nr:tRNA (adenosine(37)-N6)-dimethylallyltransferase MiaA [Candidatus Daviesbacteria bacterium]
MKKILVILGPTATGKTDLALVLAKKFNGELIACDSRQVYIGLDIGTGKMPSKKLPIKKVSRFWEINGIRIWMYDVVSPNTQYSVANYVKEATLVIEGVLSRKKLPIVVGGTGLYLKSLLEGLSNLAVPVDLNLRNELDQLTVDKLQQKLKKLSPKRWHTMNQSDRQNNRRLIRSIELVTMYGYMETNKKYDGLIKKFKVLKIGLTAPREVLYKRVDLRVLSRIDQGMIEEAISLYKNGLTLKRMRKLGLEYRVLADYLDGKIQTVDELIKIMQGKIHGYLRRQLTWFNKEKDIHWFDLTDDQSMPEIEKLIIKWYDNARIDDVSQN